MKWFIILSLFAFCSCQDTATLLWDGKIAGSYGGGTGTKADPFLIKTTQQLAYLAKEVCNGQTYAGVFFSLEENLDMGGALETPLHWKPIGMTKEKKYISNEDKYVAFEGCLNGNNKIISNLDCSADSFTNYVGLFSIIGKKGCVCNLNILGKNVILGCHIGGICGINHGRIINCHTMGEFKTGGMSGVGGIAGINDGLIAASSFRGYLAAERFVGGITGKNMRKGIIDNCYNAGTISMDSHSQGGIAGHNDFGVIKNCYAINSYITSSICDVEHCFIGFQKNPGGMFLGTFVNLEAMKTERFVDLLNQNQSNKPWVTDVNNINHGYPVLRATYKP